MSILTAATHRCVAEVQHAIEPVGQHDAGAAEEHNEHLHIRRQDLLSVGASSGVSAADEWREAATAHHVITLVSMPDKRKRKCTQRTAVDAATCGCTPSSKSRGLNKTAPPTPSSPAARQSARQSGQVWPAAGGADPCLRLLGLVCLHRSEELA
jgi:hypothetical protein